MTKATIHHGDVLAVLRTFKSASFDALLSDPPSGTGFMGATWDKDKGGRKEWIRWLAKIMREAKRVLKPGAYVLVWALPRTSHWTVTAIEDAGFEIRDVITHHFGSGFPKSLNVFGAVTSKLVDEYGGICDCALGSLDVGVDCTVGDDDRPRAGDDARHQGVVGGVQTKEGENPVVSHHARGEHDRVRPLFGGNSSENAGQASVSEALLLAGVRECRAEDARLGDAALRTGLEENAGSRSSEGSSVPRVRNAAINGGASCSPPETVQVRRDERSVELGGALPAVSPSDRVGHAARAGIDPDRREPRRSHADGDGARSDEGVHLCSWCGLPDREWATRFGGVGSALKPASEHWILARKPLAGTVAANVLKHGTGGLAIDACRIGTSETPSADRRETALRTGGAPVGRPEQSTKFNRMADRVSAEVYTAVRPGEALGRWPANLMLSHADSCARVGERRVAGDPRGDCNGKRPAGFANVGAKSGDAEPSARVYGDEAVETWACVAGCPVKLLDEQSGDRPGMSGGGVHRADYAGGTFGSIDSAGTARGDHGGCSRFFYVAKPSRFERELGCEHLPAKSAGEATNREDESAGLNSPRAGAGRTNGAHNFHPTVKAIALTTELAKLIMPPAIVRPRRILCPFAGSGSEVIGAMRAGWDEIHGIELEEEFVTIARARIARWSEIPSHLSVDEIVDAAERGGDKRQETLFK